MRPEKTTSANLLRRYLSGAITAPEEAELERRARTDEVLAEAMRGVQSAPEADHTGHVSRMLEKIRQDQQEAPPAKVRPLHYRWAAAVAVLLLVASSLLLLPDLLDAPAGDLAMQTEAAPAPTQQEKQIAEADDAVLEAEEAVPALPSPAPASSTPNLRPRPLEKPTAPPATARAATDRDAAAALKKQEENNAQAKRERTPAPPPPAPVTEEVAEAEAAAPTIASAPVAAPRATDDGLAAKLHDAAPGAARMQSTGSADAATGSYLNGRITSENGYPIVNALVRLPGLPLGERTDSNGVFQLPTDATVTLIEVSHPDYEPERVELSQSDESLQISLERKNFQADYDRTRWIQNGASTRIILDNKPGYASPLEGYDVLRQRIEANRPDNVPAGKVKLSFLVNPDGTLTDFQFRGRPDQATMDYIGTTLVTTSVWEVVQGEEPVRVYFKVVFE